MDLLYPYNNYLFQYTSSYKSQSRFLFLYKYNSKRTLCIPERMGRVTDHHVPMDFEVLQRQYHHHPPDYGL